MKAHPHSRDGWEAALSKPIDKIVLSNNELLDQLSFQFVKDVLRREDRPTFAGIPIRVDHRLPVGAILIEHRDGTMTLFDPEGPHDPTP